MSLLRRNAPQWRRKCVTVDFARKKDCIQFGVYTHTSRTDIFFISLIVFVSQISRYPSVVPSPPLPFPNRGKGYREGRARAHSLSTFLVIYLGSQHSISQQMIVTRSNCNRMGVEQSGQIAVNHHLTWWMPRTSYDI